MNDIFAISVENIVLQKSEYFLQFLQIFKWARLTSILKKVGASAEVAGESERECNFWRTLPSMRLTPEYKNNLGLIMITVWSTIKMR